MAPTGEACSAVTANHDEALVKLSCMIVGDFAAVLETGREVVNDGERWIGRDTGFVDGGFGDRIHFGQGLGEVGAVVDLEEILTWYSVT